ncbi:MAG: hypothetical protein IIU96_00405 [Paludibacteraceae bacterium]|nr:hypothetical protein [Paludibacteraceae bacterium]
MTDRFQYHFRYARAYVFDAIIKHMFVVSDGQWMFLSSKAQTMLSRFYPHTPDHHPAMLLSRADGRAVLV